MRKFILAAVLVALTASVADARPRLFKGRLRHFAHRVVDVPFKAAAGVKGVASGVRESLPLPCAGGQCR